MLSSRLRANSPRNFVKEWEFLVPDEFFALLSKNAFSMSLMEVIQSDVIFEWREQFENNVLMATPYGVSSGGKKATVFVELIDEYHTIQPQRSGGSVVFGFERLDLIASKVVQ